MEIKEVHVGNARNKDYEETLRKIKDDGYCPFCKPHIEKHFERAMYENEHWGIYKNAHPYLNTTHHLLVISKNHATMPDEVTLQGNSFFEAVAWAQKEFKIPGGACAFGFRFGDMDYSAGTVAHIHAQIVVPDIHALSGEERVFFYIGKPLKKY